MSVQFEGHHEEEDSPAVESFDEAATHVRARRIVDVSIAVPLVVVEVAWICLLAFLVHRMSSLL